MKKNKVYLYLIGIILLFILGSCYLFFFSNTVTDNAYVTSDNVVISSQITGFVKKINIENNLNIKKNDVLIEIDDSEYRYALHEAEAALEVKKSNLLNKKALYEQQKMAINKKKILENIAFKDNHFSRNEYKKYEALINTGAISRSVFEEKKHDFETKRESYEVAKSDHSVENENLEIINSEIQQAISNIKIAQASIDKSRYLLNKTIIQAPISGKVADLSVRVGQYISSGSNLLTLVPKENLYIIANFKETQLKNIKKGQMVNIKVDAYPTLSIIGIVDSISPATGSQFSLIPPDNATGNFTKVVQRVPVKIKFRDAPPKVLLSGLSVYVELKE